VLAVESFYQTAVKDGAKSVFAFATASVRSAENGKAFVDAVKDACGLTVEVISGEKEAEIGVLGALGKGDGALVDVGGASTELVVKKAGAFVYKKSVDLGAVRLKDVCGRDKNALLNVCEQAVRAFQDAPKTDVLYAIGGTATTLAGIAKGLKVYDSTQITGTEITRETLWGLCESLLQTPVEQIANMPCVSKGREDIIAGGAVLLWSVMQSTGAKKLIVSDRDNLEGYAVDKGLQV
jgi:exopolyphosphatase/guanosine-5'-triphosphate,3'-diphosphate pyrophosphatase